MNKKECSFGIVEPECELCELEQKCSQLHRKKVERESISPMLIESMVTNEFKPSNRTIGVSEHLQPFNHGLNSQALEYCIDIPKISNRTFAITSPFDGTNECRMRLRESAYEELMKHIDFSISDLQRVKAELEELSTKFINNK